MGFVALCVGSIHLVSARRAPCVALGSPRQMSTAMFCPGVNWVGVGWLFPNEAATRPLSCDLDTWPGTGAALLGQEQARLSPGGLWVESVPCPFFFFWMCAALLGARLRAGTDLHALPWSPGRYRRPCFA